MRPAVLLAVVTALSTTVSAQPRDIWDPPAIHVSPNHDEAARNPALLADFLEAGRQLFIAKFNVLDGAGRPNATGNSKPTIRVSQNLALYSRVAGPDANSCAGCHNQPMTGGAGDFSANVFVGAHFTDPPTYSTAHAITNERNTIGLFGAGAIEMLAREMSQDLKELRAHGLARARELGRDVEVSLQSKGVSFGMLVARADGSVEPQRIEGVDVDLAVKPFGVKGVAVSLREFTNFALNQHHGIQTQERFGWERTGIRDFDGDGVEIEMTLGQVSALTLFQASLPAPGRIVPADEATRARLQEGEAWFKQVGCATCHVPALPLKSMLFTEPNPFNRPGSATPDDVSGPITLPLAVQQGTGVFRAANGPVYVAAFTDLRRHRICDESDLHFCNETIRQDFVPTDEFLTSKLWDLGSSAPYGHRGDLTTISEAIIHHSGEAKEAKNAFRALTSGQKSAIVEFLLSLQVIEKPLIQQVNSLKGDFR
jgi:hypothetical protein